MQQDTPALRMQSRLPMIAILVGSAVTGAIIGYRSIEPGDYLNIDVIRMCFVFLGIGLVGGALLGGGPRHLELCDADYQRAQRGRIIGGVLGFLLGVCSFSMEHIVYSLFRTVSAIFLLGVFGYVLVPYFCTDTAWKDRSRRAVVGSLVLSCAFVVCFLAVELMFLIADHLWGGWSGGLFYAFLSGTVWFSIPGTITCYSIRKIFREYGAVPTESGRSA